MSQITENQSPLSPYLAFVVQFHVDTDLAHGSCVGRVEHVVSARAARFASSAELCEFIAQMLVTVRAEREAAGPARGRDASLSR